MLNQKLQQKLQQKLSPQQIQLMKLLQLPVIELEQRIKKELEENPALEDLSDSGTLDDDYDRQATTEEEYEEKIEKEDTMREDDFSIDDYTAYDDYDIPAYKLYSNNKSKDDKRVDILIANRKSFFDNMNDQLNMLILTDRESLIADYIVGNINESGYLNRSVTSIADDLLIIEGVEVKEIEIEAVLEKVQTLDPAGVGARDLQECLLLQLERLKDSEVVNLAEKIVKTCMPEFTKKHYSKILSKLKITEIQLKEAEKLIVSLNPKPGNSMSETYSDTGYIIPDFIVKIIDGEPVLTLTSMNTPELRVKRSYSKLLSNMAISNERAKKEAADFLKQKIDSANNFIDLIEQRVKTLNGTMKSILEMQYDFFMTGDEKKIKPMVLKDIAAKIDMNISTVSRVVNSKYVSTPYGTYLLKYFFSESLENNQGKEVSTRQVKAILEECIEKEDKLKPYTDDQLMDIMKEKGFPIARRTVAKYRQQLNIPVARLRKQI